MSHTSQLSIETPIGKLQISATNRKIISIKKTTSTQRVIGSKEADNLAQKCKTELEEYFAGTRKSFDLPLKQEGTDFQKKVWKQLQHIPYGETRTYGKIAEIMGNPRAARAIGMANHNNPILILVPCHRVIGADNSLTGYVAGIEAKKYLLELEKKNK